MKRLLFTVSLAALIYLGVGFQTAYASGGSAYIVQPGDTLLSVASHHGVTVSQLAAANGLYWDSWVYVGQQLAIPGVTVSPATTTTTGGGSYTVQRGDTLFSIAYSHGVSTQAIQNANGITNPDFVYVGQKLTIPGYSSTETSTYTAPAPQPVATGGGERWIDVNLSTQTVTAYEGQTPVNTVVVSTGTWQYPTVVGTYNVYVKYDKARMAGGYGADAYDLADVPYVMYFYEGYGIHGTYWHDNFGTPMSHGCVNMTTSDAAWFYNFASVGTKVVTHY
ncbi:MAG: LysM peptidoglycan-binding domain-containing protein [Chloroflexota bacterium]